MQNNYNVTTRPNAAPVAQVKFSTFMETIGNKVVARTLTDQNRNQQFIANIVSAVSSNPALAECENSTILAAALQAEAMHFPINNTLGYVYLVPFKDKKRGKVCQMQLGFKGYIQLAIRSNQYKDINVVEVKEGELGEFDPLNGQKFTWITNYEKRKSAKTIGYVGQLELNNGFKKQLYISYEEMVDHADKYSQAFSKDIYERLQRGEVITDENGKDMSWKFSSFWYKNFDEMAKKTVLRQLLSKWGIMSIEMQDAYIRDQTEIKADGTYEYIDAKTAAKEVSDKQTEEMGSVEPTIITQTEESSADDDAEMNFSL